MSEIDLWPPSIKSNGGKGEPVVDWDKKCAKVSTLTVSRSSTYFLSVSTSSASSWVSRCSCFLLNVQCSPSPRVNPVRKWSTSWAIILDQSPNFTPKIHPYSLFAGQRATHRELAPTPVGSQLSCDPGSQTGDRSTGEERSRSSPTEECSRGGIQGDTLVPMSRSSVST